MRVNQQNGTSFLRSVVRTVGEGPTGLEGAAFCFLMITFISVRKKKKRRNWKLALSHKNMPVGKVRVPG